MKKKIRVLVCGSRDWTDKAAIRRELTKLKDKIEIVIDGACRGADTLAHRIAKRELQLPTRRFYAAWLHFGRSAGPIRNKRMLDIGKPDLVLAFHEDIENSSGTINMISIARRAGIKVRIYES